MFQRCFINVSFLKIQNTMGALCFCFSPIVFLNRSHSVFVFLPLCFYFFIGQYKDETLKLKVKHRIAMFHLLKALIINKLNIRNET